MVLAACAGRQPAPAQIVLDTTVRHQTMTGWEATAQAGHEHPAYPAYRDTLLNLAADVGLNRLRLEVRSGVEHTRDYWQEGQAQRLTGDAYRCGRYETVNDNGDPRVINWSGFHFSELDHTVETLVLPMQRRLAERGVRLVLSVNYVSFFRQCPAGRRYDHRVADEYAEFALATVLHLRDKYTLVPDTWEVILEPDNTDDWSGAAIGRAIVATAARFREHGITTRFVAPSNTSMAGAIRDFDALAAVPGAQAEVAELAYHRYRGVSDDALRALAERGRRTGIRTAMLEHIGSGVDDLLDDLTIGNVSAWQQYALAYVSDQDRGGLYFRVEATGPRPIVREGIRTGPLGQIFRAAPLASVRVGATSSASAARPVAFRWTNGAVAAAVRTAGAMTLTITGLPAGRYAMTWAGMDGAHGDLPDEQVAAGGTLHAAMPVAGVLTVLPR